MDERRKDFVVSLLLLLLPASPQGEGSTVHSDRYVQRHGLSLAPKGFELV